MLAAAARGIPPAPTAASDTANPQPGARKELPSEAASAEGLIRLDATITDPAGKAVAGLRRADFSVLDNGQPQKIVAFRASNGLSTDADDALSVILLLDTLNLPPYVGAEERRLAEQFLRQNSGKMAQPVTIYSLEDSGFFLTSMSSRDGEALARAVAADDKVVTYFLPPHVDMPDLGQGDELSPHLRPTPVKPDTDTSLTDFPALAGLRALATISTTEVVRPGKKLLFWIGPNLGTRGTGAVAPNGTSLLGSSGPDGTSARPAGYSIFGSKGKELKRDLFQKSLWFSTLLRQARVTLDCLWIAKENPPDLHVWQSFLSAVPSARDASWMNLFKNILAVQSGGQVSPFSEDPVTQMNDRIANSRIFYTFTFDPPAAAHPNEYHSLKVELTQPALNVHTYSGYYDQPFYSDPLDPTIRHLTVAQLEQSIQAGKGGKPVARQLADAVLTERLTQTRLQSLLAEVHDKQLRKSLERIADESTFLSPPPAEISADPPPDKTAQLRMLNAAADYLGGAIPKLPDFFATRSAVYCRDVAPYPGLEGAPAAEPLHVEKEWKETVLYRQGQETVSSASPHIATAGNALRTYGTFGPILSLLQAVSSSSHDVTWGWWKKSTHGRRAVFLYRTTSTPALNLIGCCYPNGTRDARIGFSSDSHGELAIDPDTGAILRVQTQSELPGFVPTKRSDLMVSYGPVEIGGKTYIVPIRSVSIWRGRTVAALSQWNVGFAVWGPYETQMNDFTFDQYHMSRANSRLLPGFEKVPDTGTSPPN